MWIAETFFLLFSDGGCKKLYEKYRSELIHALILSYIFYHR